MKIYLLFAGEWNLVDSTQKDFQALIEERNIKIGNSAKIGYSAKIGDSAEIGNSAKIPNKHKETFSSLTISYMVGVIMQEDIGVFYKAVKPDLTDFHSGKYQYKAGSGDSMALERDQSIECGPGWHFTSYERVVVFAEKRPHKIISAEINMQDIMAVHNKVRVRKFSNVKIVELK